MITPTMNDDLFDKIIQRINDDPDAFDMTTWLSVSSCGTIGCLAGHTVLELGYKAVKNRSATCILGEEEFSVLQVAESALGLSYEESDYLFRGYEGKRPATKEDVVMRWKKIKEGRNDLSHNE